MICLRLQCVLGIGGSKNVRVEKYLLNPSYGERIAMYKLRFNIKLPIYNIIVMFDIDIYGLYNLCLHNDEYHYVLYVLF